MSSKARRSRSHCIGSFGRAAVDAVRGGARLTPLAGRNEEIVMLPWRWERARHGDGQLVMIVGEPGLGSGGVLWHPTSSSWSDDCGSVETVYGPTTAQLLAKPSEVVGPMHETNGNLASFPARAPSSGNSI
jgi:hypothetical protein